MAVMPEDDYRALIEQATLLDQLREHPGWPVLVDWLEERMRADKKAILNGLVKDQADYQGRAGKCVGATWAIDAARDVQQLVANERERRAQAQPVEE